MELWRGRQPPKLLWRMERALRLDQAFYADVRYDRTATQDALLIVVTGHIAVALGTIGQGMLAGRGDQALQLQLIDFPVGFLGWFVWYWLTYQLGTLAFRGRTTWLQLLRTTGFAYTPALLGLLFFIPIIGDVALLVMPLWLVLTYFRAIRAGLDLSTRDTIITMIVTGIITQAFVLGIYAATGRLDPAMLENGNLR